MNFIKTGVFGYVNNQSRSTGDAIVHLRRPVSAALTTDDDPQELRAAVLRNSAILLEQGKLLMRSEVVVSDALTRDVTNKGMLIAKPGQYEVVSVASAPPSLGIVTDRKDCKRQPVVVPFPDTSFPKGLDAILMGQAAMKFSAGDQVKFRPTQLGERVLFATPGFYQLHAKAITGNARIAPVEEPFLDMLYRTVKESCRSFQGISTIVLTDYNNRKGPRGYECIVLSRTAERASSTLRHITGLVPRNVGSQIRALRGDNEHLFAVHYAFPQDFRRGITLCQDVSIGVLYVPVIGLTTNNHYFAEQPVNFVYECAGEIHKLLNASPKNA